MSADMKSPPGGDAEGANVAEHSASRSDRGHGSTAARALAKRRPGPLLAGTPAMFDPGPPAAWPWLSTDSEALARGEFVVQVLFGQLAPDELVDCCELFRLRWGTPALIAALRFGHRQAPLPDAARQLLAAYTAEAAA
jgi:hypothetical protein